MNNYTRQAKWYMLTGLNREIRKDFEDRFKAFDYLNKVEVGIDNICLFCNGDLRYTKNNIGIYDEQFHVYLKKPLETEHNNKTL